MDSSTVAVTLLLIMSSTVIMTVKSQGASTCTVEQKTPEQAVLTCDFKTDVQLQTSIAVKFTPNNSQEVQIATCSKTIKQPELQCKREDVGYQIQVSRPQGSFLNITIPTSMEGTFTCMLLPANPKNSGTCTFKKYTQSNSESKDSSPMGAGHIVLIVLAVIVVVVLVALPILWRTGKLKNCCQRLPCLHSAPKTESPPGETTMDATQEQSETRTTTDTTDQSQKTDKHRTRKKKKQKSTPEDDKNTSLEEKKPLYTEDSESMSKIQEANSKNKEDDQAYVKKILYKALNSAPLPTKTDMPKDEGRVRAFSMGYTDAPQTDKTSCVNFGQANVQIGSGHAMSMKLYPDGVQEMNVTPVRAPQNSTSEESELIKSIGTIVDTRIAGHISTLSSMFRDERRRSPQSASTRHHLSGDEHSNESDNCITNTSFSPDIIKKPPYFRTPAPTDQRPDQSEIKASSPDYAAGVDFDLPGRVIDIRGDGHCLLHAAAKCLEAERHPECSSEDIKRKLMEEWHAHKDTYYCPFLGASVQDVEKELEDYTELKHFDSDSGDLIVSLLCNAMETEITIYYGMEMRAEGAGSKGSISHPPGRKEIKAKYFIKLLREGEGNFAHYSAIINAPNTNPTPQNTPTFPKKIAA